MTAIPGWTDQLPGIDVPPPIQPDAEQLRHRGASSIRAMYWLEVLGIKEDNSTPEESDV